MERVLRVTEALEHFDELIREVAESKEAIIVEDDGTPQVVILSVTEYERLRMNHSGNWLEHVDKVREQIGQELGGRTLPQPEEIIREMREERDAQILDNLRPHIT